MIKLQMKSGPSVGREYAIESFPALLGRADGSAIRLKDQRISRKHAQLVVDEGKVYLEDLGSTHGTFLNNVSVKKKDIQLGDSIRLANLELQVVAIQGHVVSSAASGSLPSESSGKVAAPTYKSFPQQTIVQVNHNISGAAPSVVIEAGDQGLKLAGRGATSRQLDQANERLFTMIEVASQLTSIRDLKELLEEIMNRLFQIFRQAERGFILLRNDEGELEPEVVRNQSRGSGNLISVSSTVLNKVVKDKKALIISDVPGNEEFGQAASIVIHQTASMMVAPLLYRDEVLGAVHIDTTVLGKAFREEDLNLLAGIASGAAIALKNALLLEEVRREATVRTALARHLSPALVEQFLDGKLDLEKVGGEVRHGTVLFCDLIGFTSMAERLRDPRLVVELLNHYFERMETAIFSHGGTIDKFAGDAIMAYWGVLLDCASASRDAVLAALEMQNHIPRLNAEFRKRGYSEELGMGLGMNTGTLLAGNIGSHQKIEFTLIGDNVNLAQRIESLAGRGQVLTSRSTFEEIATEVAAIEMPSVHVKNKAVPVEIYSIRAVRDPENADELVCSIPVKLDDSGGEDAAEGLVIAALSKGQSAVELRILTPLAARQGDRLKIIPNLLELPGSTPFEVEVLTGTLGEDPERKRLSIAHCQVIDGDSPMLQLLLPGQVVKSPLSAAELVRA